MAAKKILILLTKKAKSLRSLRFANKYFQTTDFSTTVILPNTASTDKKTAEEDPLTILPKGQNNTGEKPTSEESRLLSQLLLSGDLSANVRVLPEGETKELLKLSKYFDLMVGCRNAFDSWGIQSVHSKLAEQSCAQLILPADTNEVKRIVFINDGSSAGLQAIKRFCRLVGRRFEKTHVYLLITEEQLPVAEQKMLVDYLKAYFNDVAVHHFAGEAPDKLRSYLKIDSDMLLVTGGGTETEFLKKYFTPAHVAAISDPG